MERIRHIKETAKPFVGDSSERGPEQGNIMHTEYDLSTEVHTEQVQIRDYIKSFDEDTIEEIFAGYFRRSGSDEDSMNWVPFSEVKLPYIPPEKFDSVKSLYGQYSLQDGIVLNCGVLIDNPERTLWTLIHEECHAISQDILRTNLIIDDNGTPVGLAEEIKVGVEELVARNIPFSEIEYHDMFRDINEGITELLTERIYSEYKKRTGTSSYEPALTDPMLKVSDTERTVASSKFDGYERNWQNIKLYIGIVAAIAGVSEDVVENSVIRTYIRNGNILLDRDGEVVELLSDIDPQLGRVIFSMIYSKQHQGFLLSEYVDFINHMDIPEDIKNKISIALQKIKDEWGDAYKISQNSI